MGYGLWAMGPCKGKRELLIPSVARDLLRRNATVE